MSQEELEKLLTNNPMLTPISQETVAYSLRNHSLDSFLLSPFWRSTSAKLDAFRDRAGKSFFGDVTGLNTLIDYASGDKGVLAGEAILAPLIGVKGALNKPLRIIPMEKLGTELKLLGRPVDIKLSDIYNAIRNNGRTVFENTSEEAIKSLAIRKLATNLANYKAIIKKQANKDAAKVAKKQNAQWEAIEDPNKGSRNFLRGKYKKPKEEIIGSPDNPELTSYIEDINKFEYKDFKGIESNFNRFMKEMAKKYRFTRSKASELFTNAFLSYFKKNGGTLNYSKFYK